MGEKGFLSVIYQVLGQNSTFISDQEEEAMIEKAFEPPYMSTFCHEDLVERSLSMALPS